MMLCCTEGNMQLVVNGCLADEASFTSHPLRGLSLSMRIMSSSV